MVKIIGSIFIICLFCVVGQTGLKIGMRKVGRIGHESLKDWRGVISRCIFNPLLWVSVFLYFFALIGWLMVLSRVDLSLAFPLLSMNYVLIMFSSSLILKETLTWQRIAGAVIICVGIAIIR